MDWNIALSLAVPWEDFCIEEEEGGGLSLARTRMQEGFIKEEEEEKEKEKEKVVVFKLDLHNEKDKKKAIKIVSGFAEVKSFSVDMEDRELTVIGDIDAVLLASKLREWFDTHLMSIEAAF